MAIWYILRLRIWWQYGMFSPVLVHSVKKALATLHDGNGHLHFLQMRGRLDNGLHIRILRLASLQNGSKYSTL
jgi:hypothetical protein